MWQALVWQAAAQAKLPSTHVLLLPTLLQLQKRPNPKYLETVQSDVNAKMRAILVDWLVEVSEEYKLCADTLYQVGGE